MKNYDIIHVSGKPDWSAISPVSIDQHLWSDVHGIVPQAQAAWDENGLYIRLSVKEKDIKKEFSGPLAPVWEDSCLEFFFSPNGDDRYFNFECNPNGAFYAGYGKPIPQRYRLHEDHLPGQLQVTPFTLPDGWGVEFQVPVSLVQVFVPDFQLSAGMTLRANFYKCGDATVEPHFIAWNPIDLPEPCFHCPEFFGKITLK